MQDHATPRPIILCPLRFERNALRRAGMGGRAEIICCGPGPAGIERWASTRAAPAGNTVILAGLAGSLTDALAPGAARTIGCVIGANGRRWTPSIRGDSQSPTQIASSARVLSTADEKRAFGSATSADLADLESEAFAQLAESRGWRWTIVRGVSDGPDDHLPPDLESWVDARGRTRWLTVARNVLRRPTIVPPIIRLGRTSAAAMRAVAKEIAVLFA